MKMPSNCTQNTDPLKLIREGTSQDQRFPPELAPTYVPVDERKPEHAMMFAKAYAKHLNFFGSQNTVTGNWEPFFSQDVSVQLAIAAVQDIDDYKNNVKASFDFLKNNDNKTKVTDLQNHLGYLFSTIGTVAKQLDALKEGLPPEISLKGTLQNMITGQLSLAFRQLLLYYRDGINPDPPPPPAAPYLNDLEPIPTFSILGGRTIFKNVRDQGLSMDWIAEDNPTNWVDYLGHLGDLSIYPATKVYGDGATVFERLNHIATHNQFTAIFEQFLKALSRTVIDAKSSLEATFTNWDNHEPHYALFLSFLKLFDHARDETNTLTQRHLDFYYREILKLKEKPAEPSHAHLLIELAKHVDAHEIKADELFKAGKDDLGIEAFFANDTDFIANQAKVTELKTLYRHKNVQNDTLAFEDNRLFASPISASADGLGAKLTSTDQSWHPFFNKTYKDGKLTSISMPHAEVGFAIASHYMWMAEGERTITVVFKVFGSALIPDSGKEIICLITTDKGWFEITKTKFMTESGALKLELELSGADPAVTSYLPKTHGYDFATNLPILLVKLRHQDDQEYLYSKLQDIVIETIDLTVAVTGLKSLAVSNDFGSVDTSKPFQPFGASPVAGNALIIGSKEIFQKKLVSASVNVGWLTLPNPYKESPNVNIDFLNAGLWVASNITAIPLVGSTSYPLTNNLNLSVLEEPDLVSNEFYDTASRHGFVRLKLTTDFGQGKYQTDLLKYVRKDNGAIDPGNPPVGSSANALSLNYLASQTINLNTSAANAFTARNTHFFHLTFFGQGEQHPYLKASIPEKEGNISDKAIYLLPQLNHLNIIDDKLPKGHLVEHEAEFYIGITGLKPPQNLAVLFQISDGTADPLSIKPSPHIHWSYLSGNEWISFAKYDVQDGTNGLLNSGIIMFSIPDEASSNNTLLATGQYWFRAAVAEESDAVCRLLAVSAQGLTVTFKNRGNDPEYPAKTLPVGTISKLDQPNAAVKKVSQPFNNFGGRAIEQPSTFYMRISERLRHKDRAITLWDYEHLVLEAFPQIYKVKCLNHTFYDNENGINIYKELAPGHVTIVTIPNQFHNVRDPLRPYTSLGLLENIKAFLLKRLSCFVKLHVKNPLFEEVGVTFKVRFFEGFDETFYANKLEEAIIRFLSPWAFPGGGNPFFGGKVYQSILINFVEEQPYVDYVTDFKLSHTYIRLDSTGAEIEVVDLDVAEVTGSKAVSVLVSAKHHTIEVINPAREETPSENCPCAA